jgi:hypothetical protein
VGKIAWVAWLNSLFSGVRVVLKLGLVKEKTFEQKHYFFQCLILFQEYRKRRSKSHKKLLIFGSFIFATTFG